jgi:outer membrane protein OmpU
MNKLLIGTAAAALFTVPAVAGPMAVTVGGYYNAVVYSQDVDNTDTRDVGIHNDAEIYFKGKGTTNGGLEIGFMVQLEAEGGNTDEKDHIDENYVYVKGDFGKVEIGAENNAPYKQQVAAPKIFGWKTYDNNFATWGGKVDGNKISNFDKPLMDGIDSDALKINYYTPTINGFQFAASYTPDTSDTNGDTGLYSDTGSGTATAFGIKYSGKIGDMKVKASYGVNELDEDTGQAEAEDDAFGLSVSSGPITVGGNFQTVERAGAERDILHYGVEYKLSKASKIGFIIHDQEEDNGDELEIIAVGGSTKLGAGTTLTYSFESLEDDVDGDSEFFGVGLLLKF